MCRMAVRTLSRRQALLGLGSLGLVSWPRERRVAAAAPSTRTSGYEVEISMVFDLLRYAVSGQIVEEIDPGAGRYRVLITGSGRGVSSHVEARGLIGPRRYRPLEIQSTHRLAGRESRLSVRYDHARGLADYHAVGHTLLKGRRRQVDDLVVLPPGRPIDDAVSASLNFAAGWLAPDADGVYELAVLRRVRPPDEGPDDVSAGSYRVEVAPARFRVEPDPATGKLVALMGMTGWSPWARADHPARLVFTPARRLESVESRLMLGSAVRMRLT